MLEQISHFGAKSDKNPSPQLEATVVKLPSRLRIHQRMGHMPPAFQRELGSEVESIVRHLTPRKMTAGRLVTQLSTIIAESSLGVGAMDESAPEAIASNKAVEYYMPKILKQLIDDPIARDKTQMVYSHARLAEMLASSSSDD